MKKITKSELTSFRNDFNKAVAELEEKYGASINIKNISYDDFSFTTKLEFERIAAEGEKSPSETKAEKDWNQNCLYYGFKPEHLNTIVVVNGQSFKIIGLNTRSPKNCVKIQNIKTGVNYKCGLRTVAHQVEGFNTDVFAHM